MKLIDNWKDWWKMWSIRINALVGFLIVLIAQFPDIFLQLWVLIPEEIKQSITTIDGIASAFLSVLIISSFARVVKQNKLHKDEDNKDVNG